MTPLNTLFEHIMTLVNFRFYTKTECETNFAGKTIATTTSNGLMSSTDKSKLENITVVNTVADGNTGVPTSDSVYDYINDKIGDIDEYITS